MENTHSVANYAMDLYLNRIGVRGGGEGGGEVVILADCFLLQNSRFFNSITVNVLTVQHVSPL